MTKKYSAETRDKIRGFVRHGEKVLQRTPLHVDFQRGERAQPSRVIEGGEQYRPRTFNAIGSRCVGSSTHLPVIDADNGAWVSQYGSTSKLAIGASAQGSYTPRSNLRDLLGDHGIDLEVFQTTRLGYGNFSARTYSKGAVVTALVLRSQSPVFHVEPSTNPEHAHAYIDVPFTPTDHTALLYELVTTGVISDTWHRIARREHMAIVRTPWTAKEPEHFGT